MGNRGPKIKHRPVLQARAPARQGDAAAARRALTRQQHPESDQAPAGRSALAIARRTGSVDQSLLQMQRQSGNRSVQRALGLAPDGRQGQNVPPSVARRIQLERGGGQALDRNVRVRMERALGTDFRGVRVHTDAEADALNRVLRARAFTTGRDIFFRQGAYNPESSAGRELIAHELTHVLHQGNRDAGPSQRKMAVSQPGDRFEREANQVAQAMVKREQHSGRPSAAGGSVQLQAEDEKKALQAKPEDEKDKAVQAKPEDEKDKAVQAKAEDEKDKVQTQLEDEKDKAVQAKAEDEEDKVQTQPEEDKDKAVQAKEEEDKI